MHKLLIALVMIATCVSCHVNVGKTVKGNGRITSEDRSIHDLSKIKVRGGINVEVMPGSASLKVEADDNLLRYIETYEEDGWVIIKTKNNVNLKSKHPVRVYISTDRLMAINIAGSGNVKGQGKFGGAERLDIRIAGSGDVALEVNTPKVNVDIMGSGFVRLSGETRDAHIEIGGSGDYQAQELLTENTSVEIRGSGDAKVHADSKLNAEVMGSGTVYYRGNASVRSNTAGSGKVKPMQ